jgi:hypothetical protein
MTDAERHRLVLEGMLKDADFEVAAAHTTFARYGPMSRSRIARLEAKALALAAAVAALRAQEEAGEPALIHNLREALIRAGHRRDCPVVAGASADCVAADDTCAPWVRQADDPRYRVPAVPTGAQPDEATIQRVAESIVQRLADSEPDEDMIEAQDLLSPLWGMERGVMPFIVGAQALATIIAAGISDAFYDGQFHAALTTEWKEGCALDHIWTAAQLKRVLAGSSKINRGDREIIGTVATMLDATSHEPPCRPAVPTGAEREVVTEVTCVGCGKKLSIGTLALRQAALREAQEGP